MGFGFFLREDILYNGIKFFYEDQYEIAAVFLEKAYQTNSNNVVIIYYIALLKFELKDYQASSQLFHEVINSLTTEYAPKYRKAVWFRVLLESCNEYCRQIMDKLDDTINLSELNPRERSPDQHMKQTHTEEQEVSPNIQDHMNGEVRRNLSQLSISQIAIEPHIMQNTEMSQAQ